MKKWVSYALAAFAVAVIASAIFLTYYLKTLESRLNQRVTSALSQRFDADVRLKSLHFSLFPVASVDGDDLVIVHRQWGSDAHPLIKIGHFHAQTDYTTLLDWRNRVNRVTLKGLEIHIPPRGKGVTLNGNGGGSSNQPGHDTTRLKFLIETIVADASLIEIEPQDQSKEPLRFLIEQLAMHSVGPGQAMTYTVRLRNAVPPGDIDASGHFGPWQRDDPRSTAVSGDYTFKNADLGVFSGIRGTLSSEGQYGGVLQHIKINGITDVPNFSLREGGAAVHLTAHFHSEVDGTNGDTQLNPVDAKFGHSEFLCTGGIAHHAGEPGKRVELNAQTKHGRMEDILTLVVGGQPTVKGDMEFQSRIFIPPGKQQVIDKLQLDGAFHLGSAVFTDPKAQQRLQTLSERASGFSKSEVAHGEGEQGKVASNLLGRFKLDNGQVNFKILQFEVPGARIRMAGTYNMKSSKVDMQGTFAMRATLSQTQSGIKELLLKPLDRFFEKDGQGFELPISVEGTRDHPVIGVTLFHRRFDIH